MNLERTRMVLNARHGYSRNLLTMASFPSADDHIVGFQQRTQLADDLVDGAGPFLGAQPFQTPRTDVLFVGSSLLVRQMREFHRRDDGIDDHRGTESRSQADKQHAAAFITAD